MQTQEPASGADSPGNASSGNASPGNASPSLRRRQFLVVGGKSMAVLACVGVVWAALRSVHPPARRWLRWPRIVAPFQAIAAIDSLPPGEWTLIPLTSDGDEIPKKKRSVWVRRERDDAKAFRVLSAACTHAGCPVAWRSDRKLFVCPCHGGTFDADGNRKSGPPQRSLAAIDCQVKDGQLLLRSEDL